MLALVQDFLGFYNLQYSLNVLNSEASFVSLLFCNACCFGSLYIFGAGRRNGFP